MSIYGKKPLKNILRDENADYLDTFYTTSGTQAQPNSFKR